MLHRSLTKHAKAEKSIRPVTCLIQRKTVPVDRGILRTEPRPRCAGCRPFRPEPRLRSRRYVAAHEESVATAMRFGLYSPTESYGWINIVLAHTVRAVVELCGNSQRAQGPVRTPAATRRQEKNAGLIKFCR